MPPGKFVYLTVIGFFCLSGVAGAGTAGETIPVVLAPLPIPRPEALGAPINGEIPGTETLVAKKRIPSGRATYRSMIEREAKLNGLPVDIADAVTAIESAYDPAAIGGVGEVGLMQVRPETAAMMGFVGRPEELAQPAVNLHYGIAYLAQAWRLANGDLCRTLMKYRAGHGEEVMSPLSVQYCSRARAHLAAIDSSFADGISAPLVFDSAPLRTRRPRRGPPQTRTAAVSAAFWIAHEARVKALTRRIEDKWRRMAAR